MTILLTTLNARYQHCAFGLRYLLANMGELRARTQMHEFSIQQPTLEIVAEILRDNPRIVGFGVYIWNVAETTRVVANLKRVRPEIIIVLGGPEVSYEVEQQEICQLADYVITGEADFAFAELCQQLLHTNDRPLTSTFRPVDPPVLVDLKSEQQPRIIAAPLPDLQRLTLPYAEYSDHDLAQRVIYVEASRGCPFTCEFCLSALEIPVRQFPLEPFLREMQCLLDRGARQFKFVDRTFNLNLKVSRAILEFFLERMVPGLFLHFEMIPDRLPEALKTILVQFPAGTLQLEIGIQTFNAQVGMLISRQQDNSVVEENLCWLRQETKAHLHTDLIAGLPGESLESFADGFDRLVALQPQEIQVGILKRLRGTPIIRHDAAWGMIYSPHPPYEILQTRILSFPELQEIRHFAKYWDLVANSGNFVETLPWIWQSSIENHRSAFAGFQRFSRWLYAQAGQTHGLALTRLVELVFRYLHEVAAIPPEVIAPVMWRDYARGQRSDLPICLRPWLTDHVAHKHPATIPVTGTPKRQARHQ